MKMMSHKVSGRVGGWSVWVWVWVWGALQLGGVGGRGGAGWLGAGGQLIGYLTGQAN